MDTGQGRYGDYHGIFIRTHSDHGGYTFNGADASGSFPVTDNVAYHFQEAYIFCIYTCVDRYRRLKILKKNYKEENKKIVA